MKDLGNALILGLILLGFTTFGGLVFYLNHLRFCV